MNPENDSTTQRLEGFKKMLLHGALGFVLFVFASTVALGEGIDRLLASVNGKVITEGDRDVARSLKSILIAGSKTASDSETLELSRLIDFELLRQELKNFGMAGEDENEIQSRLQSLRESYAAQGGLAAFLQKCGLQESELISYLRLSSSMLRFVDFRFRPFVNVTQEEIKSYYENVFKPQMENKNGALPPLPEVSISIEAILKETKITEAYDQWIAAIRRNSRIERFDNEKSRILLEWEDR